MSEQDIVLKRLKKANEEGLVVKIYRRSGGNKIGIIKKIKEKMVSLFEEDSHQTANIFLENIVEVEKVTFSTIQI